MRGWSAMTSDPEWGRKLMNASLLVFLGLIVPIVGPILLQLVLLGWSGLMLRRAISGQDSPLPRIDFDFDYLGKLVNVGFKAWLARMVWSMPIVGFVLVSLCCMYGGMFFVAFGSAAGAAGAANGSDGGAVAGGIGSIAGVCMIGAFFMLYPLGVFVLQMPLHIGLIRAEITDDVNQAMRFKDVIAMARLLFWELLGGQFIMGLLTFCLILVGELALCIGIFPAVVVANILVTYWHAELYKRYLEKGGAPLPVGPLSVEGGDVATVQPQAGAWNPPQQF